MYFFVPCLPVAQPRAKATTVNGRARMYEAKKSHPIHAFKAAIKQSWYDAGRVKLDGPIEAEIHFYFPRPKSLSKKAAASSIPKTTKPDCDNLAKAVLDALNGLAYHDDSQVCGLTVTKVYASANDTPGVSVTIIACGEINDATLRKEPRQ